MMSPWLDFMKHVGIGADVKLVGVAAVVERLAELQRQTVDLMFLDIQMPGLNGLEVVAFQAIMPVVVFTAYDEYAVRAFEANAVDYLLKPFEAQRVKKR